MSLNSSLYTSLSGITASQTALSVSSNNMVNVSTEGYTRQQAVNSAIYTPQSHTTLTVGGGVQIQEIRSISDQFLRANLRESTTELGYWSSQQSYLTEVESAYGDLYGSNIQTVTDEFLNTWEELSKDPSDLAARATVYETGVALSDMIVSYNEQLEAIENSAVTELEDTVERINSITGELAAINKQVTSYSEDEVPLELIDYRENLMDELSSYVECTFSYQSDGSVDVISSNGSLVYGQTSNELETISTPPSGLPEIRWAGGSLYNSNSGTLSALVDLVDPEKSPSFNELYDLLNDGMMQLVDEVNTIHESGIGLDGETGISFFVPINDEEPLSIGNMMVNPVLEDVNKIAASTTGEFGDGSKATEIADLQLSALIEFEGSDYTIDQYLASYTQWLGAQTQNATLQYDHQSELNTQMVTQLDSISSVSVDEEMANMVMFQQMYNANVTVMNTIDELLEGLIQKLG
jgi:flagellar hook-associated protein 1 FlgK